MPEDNNYTSEEGRRKIERQYYNQQVTQLLRELEKELGCSIDVSYIKDKDLVKPDTIKLIIPEGIELSPEILKEIETTQDEIVWFVTQAKGKVDFFDRIRTNLD